MKTLREEIEKLRDRLKELANKENNESSMYEKGQFDGYRFVSMRLNSILVLCRNEHTEPISNGTIADAQALHEYGNQPTAPSQRERIATAVFVSILSEKDKAIHIPTAASSSVYSADALIEELNKKTK